MKTGLKPVSAPSANVVAITGSGAVCSIGNSVPGIVEAFLCGKSGADAGGAVKNLPAFKTAVPPQLALTMGKHLALLMASVDEALRTAGISSGMFDPGEMGFFAGMGMVDYHVEDLLGAVTKSLGPDGDLDCDRFFAKGYREIYPLWPLGMLNNVAFCQASIHFGLRGENSVFCPHGDGAVMAVYEAARVLKEGRAKVALAGGISEEISPLSLARARFKGVLQEGAKTCGPAPFLGEAGAMLVLEPSGEAVARGARILGRIEGFGFSCERSEDGRFASTRAIVSAMRQALCDAGLKAGEIDSVMPSGFDKNELDAVREVFDESAVVAATSQAVGEIHASGPVLNAAMALSFPGNFSPPGGGGRTRGENIGRVLLNGISCEGGCGCMIVAKGPRSEGQNRTSNKEQG